MTPLLRTASRVCGSLAAASLLVSCGSAKLAGGLPPQPPKPPAFTGSASGGWLNSVSAASASAAWAVGFSCGLGCADSSVPDEEPLILRWNGATWSQAAAPHLGGQAVLNGVSAGPDGTAWAVGESCPSGCAATSGTFRTLILHWNGSKWSRTPSPSGDAQLLAVSASSDGSAWAVGASCTSGCSAGARATHPLILRWRNGSWSKTPVTGMAKVSSLSGVTAGPDGTAWAVGSSCDSGCGTSSETVHPLALHWNGAAWSQISSPNPGKSAILAGASAGPAGTAWAVGHSCVSGCDTASETDAMLIVRWNGSTWSQTPSPSPGHAITLGSVAAAADGSAWAVGEFCTSGCTAASETSATLILRWNGSTWSQTPSPSPYHVVALGSVAAVSGGTAWAVGVGCMSACGTASEQARPVILRWDGHEWAIAAA